MTKKRYKCSECGLEVKKISMAKKNECPAGLQHYFVDLKKHCPKKRFFLIALCETSGIKKDDTYSHLRDLRLSYKQMERLLDSVLPNADTQKIKDAIWGWF